MKAKKVLAGAFASLMLAVSAIPAVSAADTVTVTVGKTEAKAGEKFSVTLDLADVPAAGINACDFGIEYDSAVITVTDVKLGKLAKEEDNAALEGVNALETNIEEGLVSIIYGLGSTDSANYITGTGTFLEISGTVSNNAKAGDKSALDVVAIDRLATSTGTATNAEIIFGNLAGDNDTYTVYTPTITNGLVTVVGEGQTEPSTEPSTEESVATLPSYTGDDKDELLYGDVNLDESVGAADVAKLVKYRMNATVFALGNGDAASAAKALEQANVQYDSEINITDVSKLQSCALKKISQDELGPKK